MIAVAEPTPFLGRETLARVSTAGSHTLPEVPGYLGLERVARGASSVVYRARHPRLPADVALKVLDERHVHDEGLTERLRREGTLLARLRHPGIVRLLDQGRLDDGRPFLVLEWVEGEDLEARLRRGPMPLNEALACVADLADAVHAMHRAGIVHRDLKPSNVRLRGGREPVLLDFGVAREGRRDTPPSADDTATGGVLGTPAYMAPEQARDASRADARADVYALGAILFRCLTGEPPYPKAEPMEALHRLAHDAPRPLGSLVAAPRAVEALVDACLARDPALRPADAEAVARALRAALHDEATPHPRAHRRDDVTPRVPAATFGLPLLAAALSSASARPWLERPDGTEGVLLRGLLGAIALCAVAYGLVRERARHGRSPGAQRHVERRARHAARTTCAFVGCAVLLASAFGASLPEAVWPLAAAAGVVAFVGPRRALATLRR